MRPRQVLGPILLIAGIGSLAFAVARREATVYLVLIVPVVTGSGPFALLGMLLIFLGFFATFLFWPWHAETFLPPDEPIPSADEQAASPSVRRRWGGVVFLGPFPIVFGSDPRMTRLMLIAGIVLFLALLVLTLFVLLA